jgi:hypothetical protein
LPSNPSVGEVLMLGAHRGAIAAWWWPRYGFPTFNSIEV